MSRTFTITGEDVEVSDGYHTMHELYQHRMILFIALCNICNSEFDEGWKSKLHSDGTMFEGNWFIMGLNTTSGKQISYHLPIEKYWDLAQVKELDHAPEYDGHTSEDVLTRLAELFADELD